jgi:predicted dehydrogenase
MSERAVVVGAGGISGAWFPPLKREKVDIAAVVDLDLERAKARIKEYELDAFAATDMKAAIKKAKPDFVLDLTVPEAHCAVTRAALSMGCHVVSEKPMAASMAEARRMVRTAEETGKLYMVSQSRRWDARHDRLRRVVASGDLGVLTTVNCDFYIGAHFGGFRDEMPSPLILDMSIHHFDLARYMTGADPVAVYAKEFNPFDSWYKGDAAASCIFEMSNGVIFTYRGSWCAEGCHTSWNGDWRIIGHRGTVLMAGDGQPNGQIVAGDTGFNRPLEDLNVPESPLEFGGMHGALREMLSYLRTGEMPQTECHDNIKSLAMVFAAMESSRKGKRVPVKIMEAVRV